jgi:CRP-like cAMP-binding protein
MMNLSESRNGFMRKVDGDGFLSKAASGAQQVIEESSELKREQKNIKPVPFNGLLTNKLLTALPGADFARLLPHLEPVSLFSGEDLYKFEERPDFVYFPETAVISHIYILEDGSTTEAAIIGKDGIVGLSTILDTCLPSYWTRITVAGSALRTEVEVIKREFARGEAMQRILLAYTGARLAQLSQKAVCNGRHSVEARLCSWLLMMYDRSGEDCLPLTHEAIAHHLGTRRAGITGVAQHLRDQQFISYSRGHIRILNRQGLESVACECYRTLKRLAE